MKTLITSIIFLCGNTGWASAQLQQKRLEEAYKAQGDEMFIPLYWLPETRQTVRKYIPDHDWTDFEIERWKKIGEDKKLILLAELGAELDRMEGDELDAWWKRVRDWQRINLQISLLREFLDRSSEGFLDMAFPDPTLRPAFQRIIDSRPPNFDTTHIGATLASGEISSFYAHLVEHLLDTSERQRLECFSRLLARIAETKPAEAELDGAVQPATAPESTSEGEQKPKPESEGRSE